MPDRTYILASPSVCLILFYLLYWPGLLFVIFFMLLSLFVRPFGDMVLVNDFEDSRYFLPFDTNFLPPSLWLLFLFSIFYALITFISCAWKYSVFTASCFLISIFFLFDFDFFSLPGFTFSLCLDALLLSLFLLTLHLLKYSLCCLKVYVFA